VAVVIVEKRPSAGTGRGRQYDDGGESLLAHQQMQELVVGFGIANEIFGRWDLDEDERLTCCVIAVDCDVVVVVVAMMISPLVRSREDEFTYRIR